jgi:uncharacterized membrane protein (UPF0182 family)
VLRYVLASFGKEAGYGTTLKAALDNVLGVTTPSTPEEPGTQNPGKGTLPKSVEQLLTRAEAQFAKAEAALQDGDLQGYAAAQQKARELVAKALANVEPTPPADKG